MNRRTKRKRERRRQRRQQKAREQKALPVELNDIADAVADRLLNPADEEPEGMLIEYEVQDLKGLALKVKQKLPVKWSVRQRPGARPRLPKGHMLLWHGTSLHRAHSILRSGFRSKRRGVFFSPNIMESMSYAERRAVDGHSEPALFAAIRDLSTLKYGKEFRLQTHYIFRPGAANRAVKYLLTCHGLHSIHRMAAEGFRDDLTDITITQGSDMAGIAYWLNSFLDLDDSECIPEDHPAVGQIKAWVDEQYERGRMMPIADEEILILAKEALPEYFLGGAHQKSM